MQIANSTRHLRCRLIKDTRSITTDWYEIDHAAQRDVSATARQRHRCQPVRCDFDGTYPADIAPTESLFYDAGASTRFRLPCVRSKAQVGKMWWSSFRVPRCLWMVRRLPVERWAAGKVCFKFGADGTALHCADAAADRKQHADFHVLTGSVGLNLALLILPCRPRKTVSQPTIKTVADYIAATVALNVHFQRWQTDQLTPPGATLDRRMAGRMQWGDIESDRAGTVAIEHIFGDRWFIPGWRACACMQKLDCRSRLPGRRALRLLVMACKRCRHGRL